MVRGLKHDKTVMGFAFVLVLAGPAAWVLADSPKVIKAIPDDGDTDVDPNLKEIRVEFEQDMNPNAGYSICGGGPELPKLLKKPRWISKRAFVWRVKLQPNHEYRFSINCPSAQNFRGVNGQPAEIYPIWFRTGSGTGVESIKLTSEQNKQAIQELRQAIDERYSYRDLRNVDWDKLFADYAPKLEKAKTPNKFARIAGKLLSHAQDIHIWLKVGEDSVASHRRKGKPNFNLQVLPSLVPEWKRHNHCVSTGRFPDGIGYIMIKSWSPDCREGLEAAFEALDEFHDAKGLIIDIRPNSGGDELLAQDFAGCFVDEPVVYSKNAYRNVDQPGGFTQFYDRVLKPKKGRPKYRGKVVVLIGPLVMSSCESFVLMMKQVPNCQLVGARTYGSSGNPKPVELSNGVTVYLPSWKDMFPDGTLLEGRGVAPDVQVEAKKRNFRSGDPVLEAARTLLRA